MIGARAKIVVRDARVADGERLAEVHAESWRDAYRGLIPHLQLEAMISRRSADWWRKSIRKDGQLLVIEAGGTLAGYASCGAARSGSSNAGEIYEIYLAPLYQGLGLGEFLFEACRNNLDGRGLRGLIVWALEDNHGAAAFYFRRGGRPVARTLENFGNTRLGKIGFSWN